MSAILMVTWPEPCNSALVVTTLFFVTVSFLIMASLSSVSRFNFHFILVLLVKYVSYLSAMYLSASLAVVWWGQKAACQAAVADALCHDNGDVLWPGCHMVAGHPDTGHWTG